MIVQRMQKVAKDPDRQRIQALKAVNRQKLHKEGRKFNTILAKIPTWNVTQSNYLLYAVSVVVAERLGVKITREYEKKELMWKRRFESQVRTLRKDLSRTECLTTGKTLKT